MKPIGPSSLSPVTLQFSRHQPASQPEPPSASAQSHPTSPEAPTLWDVLPKGQKQVSWSAPRGARLSPALKACQELMTRTENMARFGRGLLVTAAFSALSQPEEEKEVDVIALHTRLVTLEADNSDFKTLIKQVSQDVKWLNGSGEQPTDRESALLMDKMDKHYTAAAQRYMTLHELTWTVHEYQQTNHEWLTPYELLDVFNGPELSARLKELYSEVKSALIHQSRELNNATHDRGAAWKPHEQELPAAHALLRTETLVQKLVLALYTQGSMGLTCNNSVYASSSPSVESRASLARYEQAHKAQDQHWDDRMDRARRFHNTPESGRQASTGPVDAHFTWREQVLVLFPLLSPVPKTPSAQQDVHHGSAARKAEGVPKNHTSTSTMSPAQRVGGNAGMLPLLPIVAVPLIQQVDMPLIPQGPLPVVPQELISGLNQLAGLAVVHKGKISATALATAAGYATWQYASSSTNDAATSAGNLRGGAESVRAEEVSLLKNEAQTDESWFLDKIVDELYRLLGPDYIGGMRDYDVQHACENVLFTFTEDEANNQVGGGYHRVKRGGMSRGGPPGSFMLPTSYNKQTLKIDKAEMFFETLSQKTEGERSAYFHSKNNDPKRILTLKILLAEKYLAYDEDASRGSNIVTHLSRLKGWCNIDHSLPGKRVVGILRDVRDNGANFPTDKVFLFELKNKAGNILFSKVYIPSVGKTAVDIWHKDIVEQINEDMQTSRLSGNTVQGASISYSSYNTAVPTLTLMPALSNYRNVFVTSQNSQVTDANWRILQQSAIRDMKVTNVDTPWGMKNLKGKSLAYIQAATVLHTQLRKDFTNGDAQAQAVNAINQLNNHVQNGSGAYVNNIAGYFDVIFERRFRVVGLMESSIKYEYRETYDNKNPLGMSLTREMSVTSNVWSFLSERNDFFTDKDTIESGTHYTRRRSRLNYFGGQLFKSITLSNAMNSNAELKRFLNGNEVEPWLRKEWEDYIDITFSNVQYRAAADAWMDLFVSTTLDNVAQHRYADAQLKLAPDEAVHYASEAKKIRAGEKALYFLEHSSRSNKVVADQLVLISGPRPNEYLACSIGGAGSVYKNITILADRTVDDATITFLSDFFPPLSLQPEQVIFTTAFKGAVISTVQAEHFEVFENDNPLAVLVESHKRQRLAIGDYLFKSQVELDAEKRGRIYNALTELATMISIIIPIGEPVAMDVAAMSGIEAEGVATGIKFTGRVMNYAMLGLPIVSYWEKGKSDADRPIQAMRDFQNMVESMRINMALGALDFLPDLSKEDRFDQAIGYVREDLDKLTSEVLCRRRRAPYSALCRADLSLQDNWARVIKNTETGSDAFAFKRGYEQLDPKTILGYSDKLSVLAVMELTLSSTLTPSQVGALYKQAGKRFVQFSLKNSEIFSKIMGPLGGKITHVPQMYYLSLVNKSLLLGECAALAHSFAMAVKQGKSLELIDNLFTAMANPTHATSQEFVKKMSALERKVGSPALFHDDNTRQIKSYKAITSDLSSASYSGSTKILMISDKQHAMCAGVIGGYNSKQSLFFYDPNYGVVRFSTLGELEKAMDEVFVKRKLPIKYEPYGRDFRDPEFEISDHRDDWLLKVGANINDVNSLFLTSLTGSDSERFMESLLLHRNAMPGSYPRVRSVADIRDLDFKVPDKIYRAHTGAGDSATTGLRRSVGATASGDDYLAAIIQHTSRQGGSGGEVMSFSASKGRADSFSRQYSTKNRQVPVFIIDTRKDPFAFRTVADIILKDGKRLEISGKVTSATILKAADEIQNQEKEVFYVKGDVPPEFIIVSVP